MSGVRGRHGPSARQFIPGAAFRLNTSAERLRLFRIQPMPTAKRHALTIIRAFDEAQSELVGKAVVLSDGKAGTVENVWLDEVGRFPGSYFQPPIPVIAFPSRRIPCLET